ncbi:MAG: GAF domain-containing protein [Candidatus Adiutrix sp.]|jgi:GGDEF domain-containing protein|nr:GAF domain-containing protein [Candidatus Adiutrix sp.]
MGISFIPNRRRREEAADFELGALMELCLNNFDGFSSVLFAADQEGGPLSLRAFRSLSRNIDAGAVIHPGHGLLGWAYKTNKPVIVDQVSFESDRLLFYTCDENIKSFMAVPLPGLSGVLAVDSKQRYFFTDKSAKLLVQFGQNIARVCQRLFGRPAVRKTTGEGQGGAAEPEPPENEICALWRGLEFCLSRSDHEGGGLSTALDLVRQFSGLNWAFLTVIKNSDPNHYYLVAGSGNLPEGLPTRFPLAAGLAGWLHTKLKPLAIDSLKADSRNSFIFNKNEPIHGLRSFYGWPVLYNDQPRGALVLAGAEGQTLDPALGEVLECVVDRLAAQFHLDRLIHKVMELDQIDSQTGLAHRAYFLDSMAHMLEVADIKGEGLDLFVLATAGLGSFAAEYGQEAAGELLKSIAGQLKEGLRPTWRMGHISYGVFTLASPEADAAEAKTFIAKFKKNLENWPLPGVSGRAELDLFPALASYPRDCSGPKEHLPEQLLEMALSALAEADEEGDE